MQKAKCRASPTKTHHALAPVVGGGVTLIEIVTTEYSVRELIHQHPSRPYSLSLFTCGRITCNTAAQSPKRPIQRPIIVYHRVELLAPDPDARDFAMLRAMSTSTRTDQCQHPPSFPCTTMQQHIDQRRRCSPVAYRVIPQLDVARCARVHLQDRQGSSGTQYSARLAQNLRPNIVRRECGRKLNYKST